MEPFVAFEEPYANALFSCHHGGLFDRLIDDESGYASDGPDPASIPKLRIRSVLIRHCSGPTRCL